MATGLVAGCSSDVMRFQDSILTGDSRPVQPAPVAQAYPGDYGQVDTMSTGSIAPAPRRGGILQRANLVPRPQGNVSAGGQVYAAAPVQQPRYGNPYPAAAQPSLPPASTHSVASGPALAPVSRAPLDNTITGSTPPRTPAVAAVQPVPVVQQPAPVAVSQPPRAGITADGEGGWTRAGGTQITVKPGETVYNLSRRFGVPADAILTANGLSSANALAAGQQIVIPTYVHSARAPVSAPEPTATRPVQPAAPTPPGIQPMRPVVAPASVTAPPVTSATPAAPARQGSELDDTLLRELEVSLDAEQPRAPAQVKPPAPTPAATPQPKAAESSIDATLDDEMAKLLNDLAGKR